MADPPHKRESFRIDDKVHLSVRVLTEEEFRYRLEAPTGEHDDRSLIGQLRNLTTQAGSLLASIRKAEPEIAHYLALLDRKIDLLATCLEDSAGSGAPTPDSAVNISAGGMAFWREKPLQKGTKLELHLVVFPSHGRIHALAEVVHAEEDPQAHPNRRFRIGVTFTRMGESEKDTLVRHLIELQSAQLRRQRGR